MVDEHPSVEVAPRVTSDRRLVGSVTGTVADLSIRDGSLRSRRKSWNVEFLGNLEQTPEGATLNGTIDIRDRRQLHLIVWLFRIAAGLAAIVWIALALRDLEPGASVPTLPIIGAIAFVTAFGWITARMEDGGQRAASEDARLLIDFLHRSLN
jgi:hypothetical protein